MRAILLSGGTASGHCCSSAERETPLCLCAAVQNDPFDVGRGPAHCRRVIYDRHKDDHEIMVLGPSQLTYTGHDIVYRKALHESAELAGV